MVSTKTYRNPLDLDVSDPYALWHDGANYLYGSGDDSPGCWTPRNLVDWEYAGECYTASNGAWGDGSFWAPEVICYQVKVFH